jgi:tRNA (guanine-N7-)-methyltransferase
MRCAVNSKSPLKPYLSSFGRNRGRALRPYQQSLIGELLPRLVYRGQEQGFIKQSLEIGFGGGEHLAAQAACNPETLYIGCEPYVNGVAKLLVQIDQQKLRNIRIHMGDARQLVQQLDVAVLDEIFVLFPDPWPKTKQQKRRLVNAQTLAMLARAHRLEGRLLLATDHEDYAAWMLEQLQASPHYTWLAEREADWLNPPRDWVETKYQRKTSAEGRLPMFFECKRENA